MKYRNRIELHPKVCNGKPVIKGTRIPVSVIVAELEENDSWNDLLAGYPELRREDIQAVLRYSKPNLDVDWDIRQTSEVFTKREDFRSLDCTHNLSVRYADVK